MDTLPASFADKYEVDVCPGWLVRQPGVVEASRAWKAYDKGALHLFDPDGLNVLFECAELLDRSMTVFETERQKIIAARTRAR